MKPNPNDLIQAFPREFDFYHLGQVKMSLTQPSPSSREKEGVAFRISGERTALVLVLFPKGMDYSTYAELGNVILSRVVTELNRAQNLELMITPPQFLSSKQLDAFDLRHDRHVRRIYSFSPENEPVSVETVILDTPFEEISYV